MISTPSSLNSDIFSKFKNTETSNKILSDIQGNSKSTSINNNLENDSFQRQNNGEYNDNGYDKNDSYDSSSDLDNENQSYPEEGEIKYDPHYLYSSYHTLDPQIPSNYQDNPIIEDNNYIQYHNNTDNVEENPAAISLLSTKTPVFSGLKTGIISLLGVAAAGFIAIKNKDLKTFNIKNKMRSSDSKILRGLSAVIEKSGEFVKKIKDYLYEPLYIINPKITDINLLRYHLRYIENNSKVFHTLGKRISIDFSGTKNIDDIRETINIIFSISKKKESMQGSLPEINIITDGTYSVNDEIINMSANDAFLKTIKEISFSFKSKKSLISSFEISEPGENIFVKIDKNNFIL